MRASTNAKRKVALLLKLVKSVCRATDLEAEVNRAVIPSEA